MKNIRGLEKELKQYISDLSRSPDNKALVRHVALLQRQIEEAYRAKNENS